MTTKNSQYLCANCGKQIWSINDVLYKKGVEKPVHLHAVCYDRLLELAKHFQREINNAVEGFF